MKQQWSSWNDAGEKSEGLLSGLQNVVDRAEQLLKASANYSAEGFAQARASLEDSLSLAKARMADVQGAVTEKAQQAADQTQRYVTAYPLRSLAIVAAAGIIIGLLLGQGSGSETGKVEED